MISTDNRPRDLIRKLEDGRYALFEGLSIISPLLDDLTAWHRELERLTPARVQILLPPSSYHVTLMGLWVRKDFPSAQAYNQHNESQRAKLAALDADLALLPPLRMRVDGHDAVARYHLAVAPADQDATALLHRQQNLAKGAYPAGHLSHPHVSLAYRRNNKAEFTAAEAERIETLMRSVPPALTFGAPRVCAFKDMTAFVPIFTLNK